MAAQKLYHPAGPVTHVYTDTALLDPALVLSYRLLPGDRIKAHGVGTEVLEGDYVIISTQNGIVRYQVESLELPLHPLQWRATLYLAPTTGDKS